MPLSTLTELLPEFRLLGNREAIRFHNGFRTWVLTYRELWQQIASFQKFLRQRGLQKGDRVVLWSENRPQWVVAFWGCLAQGIQIVPLDFRSSPQFVLRILDEVQARLLLYGEHVCPPECSTPLQPLLALDAFPPASTIEPIHIDPQDTVQIVFTSGTTGQPRGVVHRHRNLCSNLQPFRTEIHRYRHLARPFQPLRILSLLPLSHLFGQSLSLFIPVFLGGSAVFTTEHQPRALIDTVRTQRVSVLGGVPQMLANLQTELRRRFGISSLPTLGRGWTGAARRWWRYRRIHRLFGLKFWCLVVGGAPLNPELESFWSRLGFAVIQGYGLTESSPVIAVNHPFEIGHGSMGKPIPGQTIRLASDGEILVRGDSVAEEYLGPGAKVCPVMAEGWLHTGDIGEIDSEGRIHFRGRKKDVIVTAAGLNVFPDDVEAVLSALPQVHETVVVAGSGADGEEVHAVLILKDKGADPNRLVREANRRLEPHQRIRSWSEWTEEEFPRTPSTLKIQRGLVAARIRGRREETFQPEGKSGLEGVLSKMGARGNLKSSKLRISEDLGFSSLDRVRLLSELEDHFGISLDETHFSTLSTLGEVKQALVEARDAELPKREPVDRMPRWAGSVVLKGMRRIAQDLFILPLFRHYIELQVEGLAKLANLSPPALFAANHCSHLDTVVVLAALPRGWRRRLAPAMLKDYFLAHFRPDGFSPRQRLTTSLKYLLACGLFNAYPLPQRLGGFRETVRYTGELVDRGFCPLIFPEGIRSPDGQVQPFKPGVGAIAHRLRLPVIPVRLEGTFQVYSVHDAFPRSGSVRVKFGDPLHLKVDDPPAAVARLQSVIENL